MNVSIGPSSVAGWLAFAAGEITFAGTAIGGSQTDLHGPGKWAAIGGLISLVVTNAMRQLQAAAAHVAAPQVESLLPSDAQELASPPPNSEPAEPPELGAVAAQTPPQEG